MKSRNYLRLAIFTVVIIALSCNKDDDEKDVTTPAIFFTTPKATDTLVVGDTIHIKADIEDNSIISEVHVHILNHESGQLLSDIHRNPGKSTYEIKEDYIPASPGRYRITLIGIDNSANQGVRTVVVAVQ